MRKIVGFTSGYFDIMHPGHVLMLKECKRYCDYLIVRILGDDHKDKPFTGDDLEIDIMFNSRDHDYSTTNTIAKIIEERT